MGIIIGILAFIGLVGIVWGLGATYEDKLQAVVDWIEDLTAKQWIFIGIVLVGFVLLILINL